MFAERIDELRSFIISQTSHRCVPHWNWLCVKLVSLLSKYPAGITKAIILAEVQNSWANVNQLQGYNESFKRRKVSLDSVIETRHIGHGSIIEVKVDAIKNVPGTHTKLAVLKNAGDSFSKDRGKNSIEMYLHQKLYDIEGVIVKNKLRFTGCRLWKGGNVQYPRLLPSENVVILLESSESAWIDKEFTSLHEISYEETQPHYDKNVKVEVADVGEEEVVHLQNGETSVKRTVTVVDCHDIHAQLCLWDEQLPLVGLFKRGDVLAIWQPFVVPSQTGGYTLEYGPATIVYCLLCDTGHEVILSQVSKSTPVFVAKDSHGVLDYSTYPERIYIADFRANMINVTIMAKITRVTSKQNFVDDQHSGHLFNLTVTDDTDTCDLKIYDHFKRYHESLYPGQCVVFEGLHSTVPSTSTNFSLKTWSSGKIWNISSLSGWLATKYLVTSIISLDSIGNYDNCICKAVITRVLGHGDKNDKYIKRVHTSCLGDLHEYTDHCKTCSALPSHEFQRESQELSLSEYWQWQYSVFIDVHDSNTSARLKLMEQTAQHLFQMPVNQFASQPLTSKDNILESVLAQEYFFGISSLEDQIYQVNCIFPST